MTKRILYVLSAFMLVFAIACRKDNVITDTTPVPTPPIITVETGVLGMVTDLDGNALEGATLTLGNSQTSTDENGYFRITGVTDSDNAIVKVGKAGYFDVWRSFQVFDNDIAQTKVRLTPRTNPLLVNASNGGEIQFENAKVNFEAGSFIDENGNAYNGEVSVYAKYLDPTDPNLHEIMPGDLTAFDADNNLQLLQTFGMMNVELEGDAGQKLQINQPATIEMPVPAELVNHAPATIPLWFFDTEKQRWVEEGSAELQGNKYIGTVAHFSYWNCDDPRSLIELEGQATIVEQSASLTVCITDLSSNDRRCSQTSANTGLFGGKVPANQELLLEIISACGDVVYSETIGPFSTNTTLDPIVVAVSQSWAFIHGNAVDCDGNAISDGYVLANWNGNQNEVLDLDADGNFSKYINTCQATEINLRAVDVANLKSGDIEAFTLSSDTDAGTLEACVNDIIEGVTIFYGSDSHFMAGTTVTDTLINAGDVYQFNIVDSYNGNADKILYTFTILSWGNGVDYSFAYEKLIFGSPPQDFDFDGGVLSLTQSGSEPGDYIIFELTDVDVILNGNVHSGGSVEIVGMLQ